MGGMSSSVQVNLINLDVAVLIILILIIMVIMILGGLMTIALTAKEKMVLLKVEEVELHGKGFKR